MIPDHTSPISSNAIPTGTLVLRSSPPLPPLPSLDSSSSATSLLSLLQQLQAFGLVHFTRSPHSPCQEPNVVRVYLIPEGRTNGKKKALSKKDVKKRAEMLLQLLRELNRESSSWEGAVPVKEGGTPVLDVTMTSVSARIPAFHRSRDASLLSKLILFSMFSLRRTLVRSRKSTLLSLPQLPRSKTFELPLSPSPSSTKSSRRAGKVLKVWRRKRSCTITKSCVHHSTYPKSNLH